MGKIDNKKKELIERYLLGPLSDEDQKQFDANMDDPAFQEALELQRDILETIEYQGDMQLKAMLMEEEQKIVASAENTSKQWFSFRRIAAIAATVLFLILAGWYLLAPKEKNLFAEYFKPHTNVLYPGVKSAESLDEVKQTFLLYENGSYEKAASGFEKILSQKADDDIAFYQANTLLALDQTDEAISILQQIIQNNQTTYLIPAQWNLALAYISQEKYPEAKILLETLKADSFYKAKAEQLLQEPVFQK